MEFENLCVASRFEVMEADCVCTRDTVCHLKFRGSIDIDSENVTGDVWSALLSLSCQRDDIDDNQCGLLNIMDHVLKCAADKCEEKAVRKRKSSTISSSREKRKKVRPLPLVMLSRLS